jgi:hypothetical protein
VGKFTLLDTLPLVYPLSRFGVDCEPPLVYDYYRDTYGEGNNIDSSRPKLGIAGEWVLFHL